MEIFIVVALGALLLFMVFNTRKKQRAQQENLATNLVPGARVMTTFGLYGTVVSIDEEENKVTIESAPGTVMTLHKQTIGRIEPAASDEVPAVAVPDDASSLHSGEDKTYGEQVDAADENRELDDRAADVDADADDREKSWVDAQDDSPDRDDSADRDDVVADRDEAVAGERDTVAGTAAGREPRDVTDVDAPEPEAGRATERDPEDTSSLESAEPEGPSSDEPNTGDDRPGKA